MYKVITPEDAIKEIKKLQNQHQIFELISQERYGGNSDISNNILDFIAEHYDSDYKSGKNFGSGAWSKSNNINQSTDLNDAKNMIITAISSL